jgi:hypothetical protein
MERIYEEKREGIIGWKRRPGTSGSGYASGCRTMAVRTHYKKGRVKSIRFDAELDERVKRAAERTGLSESDFIREAVADRVDATLGASLYDQIAHLIGSVEGPGNLADHVDEVVSDMIYAEHVAQQEKSRRRS